MTKCLGGPKELAPSPSLGHLPLYWVPPLSQEVMLQFLFRFFLKHLSLHWVPHTVTGGTAAAPKFALFSYSRLFQVLRECCRTSHTKVWKHSQQQETLTIVVLKPACQLGRRKYILYLKHCQVFRFLKSEIILWNFSVLGREGYCWKYSVEEKYCWLLNPSKVRVIYHSKPHLEKKRSVTLSNSHQLIVLN